MRGNVLKDVDCRKNARVNAMQSESELRKELMREELKMKMNLLREESAARRETTRDSVGGH
jgi:hypothetical protein